MIEYELAEACRMEILILDLKGNRIKNLAGGFHPAGRFRAVWDGKDELGQPMASGVYFCTLRIGEKTVLSRKMILLK
jgi:hypothetical protein